MKKIIKIITIFTLLSGVFTLSSCGLKKQLLDNTQNQWYKYNSTIEIPLGNSDESETDSLLDNLSEPEFFVYYDEDEGLTVAIQSNCKQDIELIGGFYQTTAELPVGGCKTYSPKEFGSIKWSALMALGSFTKTSEPAIYKAKTGFTLLDQYSNGGIQWKKILKNILLNTLLGE